MLFHLLIVDDEPTIRKGLSQFIPWDSYECTVDAAVSNGLEAVSQIKKSLPDIIISDVKMPQMDGIALAKYIYENHPEIKVILLTGYADFNYAQSAIKYQVSDFIVKPTSKEKLIESVKNCKTLILNKKNLSSKNQKELSYFKEQFLIELTMNSLLLDSEVSQKLIEYGINLTNYYLVIYQFSPEQFTEFNDNFNSIHDILTDTKPENQCYRYRHNFAIVIYPQTERKDVFPNTLQKRCIEAIQIISNLYGIFLTAGASKCTGGYEQLQTSCSQAITALSYNFYNNSDFSVFQNSDPAQKTEIDVEYMLPLYDIENALNDWNFELADSLVSKLFTELKLIFMKSYDIKSICTQIYYICSRLLIKKGNPPPSGSFVTEMNQCTTIFRLQEIIIQLFSEIESTLSQNGRALSPFIENAISYINQNISGNLSLEEISDYVHIHSSYLSRTFKKECNISLTDYINQQRINKAKELLSSGNILTYEIAEKIGYHDAAYFSSTFKKYTGQTPKEFRQKQLKDIPFQENNESGLFEE